MKNLKLIAYSILAVCYAELLEHARGNSEITYYVNEVDHTISLIQNGPGYIACNEPEVRQFLLDWITQWLKESKTVLLYTCRDNCEISLDDPKSFTEDLSSTDGSPLSELEGILYMLYD
jgi:hypothetical protein